MLPVVALVVVVGLVAHGALLLLPRDQWDGALYQALTLDRDWGGTVLPFRDAGYPLHGLFHWYLGLLPRSVMPYGYHLVAFGSAVVVAVCAAVLHRRETGRPWALSAALGALVVSHPVLFWMMATGGNMPALVSLATFFLAAVCLLRADEREGASRAGWLAAGATLALLSFTWRSYILYFGGVLLLLLRRQATPGRTLAQVVVATLRRHALLVALPLIYAVGNKLLFPQRQNYATDNSFPGLRAAVKALAVSLSKVPLVAALEGLGGLASLVGVVAAAALALVAWRAWRPADDEGKADGDRTALGQLAFGAVLLGLGQVPYSVVGKVPAMSMRPWPAFDDYTARWAVLVVVPLALMTLAVAELVGRRVARSPGRVALVAAAVLVGAQCGASGRLAARWASLSLIDDALAEALRTVPVGPGDTLCLHEVPERPASLIHRHYEVSALLHEARGGSTRQWFPRTWDDRQAGTPAARPDIVVTPAGEPLGAACTIELTPETSGLHEASTLRRLGAAVRDDATGLVTVQARPVARR